MEQSKWVIVRRETRAEKFKRSIKTIFFKIFGAKNKKDIKKEKNKEIVIEIISELKRTLIIRKPVEISQLAFWVFTAKQ